MFGGSRVSDAVDYYYRRGEVKGAVRVVRNRVPERFRWRHAVGALTSQASRLSGLSRARVEEPVREIILDLSDEDLMREVVLDARRQGMDLDRGEVFPIRTAGDLRRFAFLTGCELNAVKPHVRVPSDFFAPVDTPAVILAARQLAASHRRKAQRVWLRLPDPEGPDEYQLHHRLMADHAEREIRAAERWKAFSRAAALPEKVISKEVPAK